MSVEPRVRFELSLFVPGIRLPTLRGLSDPKPLGKGSLEPKKRRNGSVVLRNGRPIYADKDEVYEWVNRIAAVALQRRSQLIASGYDPFPYRGPVQVTAVFLYVRPSTQPTGYPVTKTGINAQHDTDKLQKALGDAITPTRDPKFPLGDLLEDDRWITTWIACKRFTDQVTWAPGAGVMFLIEEEPDDHPDIRKFM